MKIFRFKSTYLRSYMPYLVRINTILLLLICAMSCSNNNTNNPDSIILSADVEELELFAEGIISTDLYERDIAISSNGDELIYTIGDYKQSLRCLVRMKKNDTTWSKGELLPFTGSYNDIEPFISPSGNKLFFASDRPTHESDSENDYNIWYSTKQNGDWGSPILMDSIINQSGDEYYPSVSSSGNLYFTSNRESGIGSEDIFFSKLIDGKYQHPEVLDSNINTSTYEFNAYINPDETLLIFSSFGRPDGFGGVDLYVSKKDEKGNWQQAKNLGQGVNSKNLDFCPFIDYPNQMFYFSSDRADSLEQRVSDLTTFRTFSTRTKNGLGNIYRVALSSVLKD